MILWLMNLGFSGSDAIPVVPSTWTNQADVTTTWTSKADVSTTWTEQ